MISVSFAENGLQLKASYGSSLSRRTKGGVRRETAQERACEKEIEREEGKRTTEHRESTRAAENLFLKSRNPHPQFFPWPEIEGHWTIRLHRRIR